MVGQYWRKVVKPHIAKKQRAEVIIHGRNGRIRERNNYALQ
jgi:hypothetical protein